MDMVAKILFTMQAIIILFIWWLMFLFLSLNKGKPTEKILIQSIKIGKYLYCLRWKVWTIKT